jgi:plastin-3
VSNFSALIWQLMRAYTLHILSLLTKSNKPITEKEIIAWVNTKLEQAGKTTRIKSFQDSSIANGEVVLDLVDAIRSGTVNYSLVKHEGTEEVSAELNL